MSEADTLNDALRKISAREPFSLPALERLRRVSTVQEIDVVYQVSKGIFVGSITVIAGPRVEEVARLNFRPVG